MIKIIFMAALLCPMLSSAKEVQIFAETPCKEAYEYHFFIRAISNDDFITFNLLLNSGVDVNGKGYAKYQDCVAGIEFSSPLMMAVFSNNIDFAEVLLKHGANPNQREGDSVTPLMITQKRGHTELSVLLIKYGAK